MPGSRLRGGLARVRTADPKRAVFFAEIVLGLRCLRAAPVPVATEEPSSAIGDQSLILALVRAPVEPLSE
jgi:hypothetical protein